ASVPDCGAWAGTPPAAHLLQTPGHRGVGPGVAARRSRENVEEALHVSPQPAHRDARAILTSGGDRLAGEEVDPEAGEVAPGVDRELQRPPKPSVHLHEPRRMYAVVAKLDHRRPVPPHSLE